MIPKNLVSHLFDRLTMLVAVSACVYGLHAEEPGDLLGELDGLQCYSDGGNSVHCLNIKTGETWKVFDRDGGTERGMGGINADGTKLACNDGSNIVVVNLDGTSREVVAERGVVAFFFVGDDGNEWVGYNGDDAVSGGTDGTTWKVRIDAGTNEPIESTREKVLDRQWTGGISNGGRYIGETYRGCLMKNLQTGEQIDLRSAVVGTQCCWGRICPEDKPRILTTPGTGHDKIAVFEWDEASGGGSKLWEHDAAFSRWSGTDDDYCVAHYDRHDGHAASELHLIRIGIDGAATETASLGVKGFVGGPWIGTLSDNNIRERGTGRISGGVRLADHSRSVHILAPVPGSRGFGGLLLRPDGTVLQASIHRSVPCPGHGVYFELASDPTR